MVTVAILEYNIIRSKPLFQENGAYVIIEELSRWVVTAIFEVSLAMSKFVRLSDWADMLKNRLMRIPVR